MVFAYRELSQDEIAKVKDLTEDQLERDLLILGGTGIEDTL